MKRTKMRALVALCAAMAMSSLASAGVLEKVPEGAWNVVKFSNLAETNKKVGALSEKLGLTFFQPQLADPLGTLKKEAKIANGLKDDGELAIVMVDPKDGRPEMSFMMLVPVSDYAGFVGNFANATKEGDFTVLKRGRQTTYFADWGGYAAISQNKDLLAAPSKTLTLQKRAGEKWDKGDVVIYSNFDAMREKLSSQLAEARTKAAAELPEELKNGGKVEEKYHPAIIALADQALNVADSFLRDAQATTISYTLSDTGVHSSLVAEFKPDSYIGKAVSSLQTTDSSLLEGLPAESFGAFMGFLNSPEAFNKVGEDLLNPVLEKLPADDELSGKIKSFIADAKGLTSKVKTVRSAALEGASPSDPEQKLTLIETTDPNFLKEARAFGDKYREAIMELPSKMTNATWSQTYTADSKTIDGVSFDLVKTEITGDSQEAEQLRQMLKTTQGTDVMEQYMGQVGNQVISFTNASDQSVSTLIASAKAGGAPLAAKENNKVTSDALPKGRVLEFYFTGDPIFKAAIRMAPLATGMPLPPDTQVQLPPDLPPIGLAVTKGDGTLEVDSYISNDLMQAMMTAGLQLGAEMMQGGGGGKNNGGI